MCGWLSWEVQSDIPYEPFFQGALSWIMKHFEPYRSPQKGHSKNQLGDLLTAVNIWQHYIHSNCQSEDDFHSGSKNVSQHQQSFSGLISSRWLNSIQVCNSWVQTMNFSSLTLTVSANLMPYFQVISQQFQLTWPLSGHLILYFSEFKSTFWVLQITPKWRNLTATPTKTLIIATEQLE